MLQHGFLHSLPKELKYLLFLFCITLSIGFYSGISFVNSTTAMHTQGLIENYNGNEENLEAETMKFKKSSHEMYSLLHTHFMSLSLVFLALGILVYGTTANKLLRKFLMIEPMVSVIVTFGGIYLVWLGQEWVSYWVMLSGILMTLSFTLSMLLIMYTLFKAKIS